ncbi:MAG TPA: CHASE3 domain-containing protein [Bacteroidia bacterium]|nr:CHASE3 domain-containing protein [Bacteroidia bacterium]
MNPAKIKTSIYLLIGVILALLIGTMLYSLYTIHRLKSNLAIQVHTTKVRLALNDGLTSLLNAETGERGYRSTGDTNYLQPYYLGLKNITGNMQQLRMLTADNKEQQKDLDTLESLASQKFALLARLISLKKQGNEKNIDSIMAISNKAKNTMDRIRSINRSMQAQELGLSEERTENTDKSIALAQLIFTAEALFSMLVTMLLAFLIIKELNTRKKVEIELATTGERFFKIFDKNPIAMTFGETGSNKVVFANSAFYRSFGYSKDEVIGHTSEELKLISPEENARILPILLDYLNDTRSLAELQALSPKEGEELLKKLKEAMGDKSIEVLYTRKNGETFYAIVSYDLIEISGKNYAITSYQDISEQKNNENRIIAYSKELERKNKEIEQFAYVASHDLQEPLRTISNFSTLLTQKQKAHPDSEEREYINYIHGSAQRMSQLIFDLLEYSRIGKDADKVPVDCDKLVSEVLTDISASIQESKAQITVKKLPVVKGFTYLKSLFLNLISNAIKFQKEGAHPVITISAIDKGNEYLFSVKDNGIGIEKTYHEKIFQIFQRLHNRTEYEGTGIGLSQCKKIVDLHGGEIWVESEPGEGSTFNFTIPKK